LIRDRSASAVIRLQCLAGRLGRKAAPSSVGDALRRRPFYASPITTGARNGNTAATAISPARAHSANTAVTPAAPEGQTTPD
jgi:hypothetical protein